MMHRVLITAAALLGFASLTPAYRKPDLPARWDLTILDGAPEGVTNLNGFLVGDIDGDGRQEILTGGEGALLWYRPSTHEKGIIARVANVHVGMVMEDIDGDGKLELVLGVASSPKQDMWEIRWYRPQGTDLSKPWSRGTIDANTAGGPHDLMFADLDGDGKRDLVVNAMYTATPGLFAYRRTGDPSHPWSKSIVQTGFSAEGTDVGDVDGDGHPDIIQGPYWFKAPAAGPFSGPWQKFDLAPDFREMCRGALMDVNGDGRLDAVVVESEYPDGRMSWFENTGNPDPRRLWREHHIESRLNFAHSLYTWTDRHTKTPSVFIAEMAQGGWTPPFNWDARLMRFEFDRSHQDWRRDLLYQGAGTHQAMLADIDGDGELEIVGKDFTVPKVAIWKQRRTPSPVENLHHRFIDREKPHTGTDTFGADVDGDGLEDIVCGSWWYKNPTWERRAIPGVHQVINAYDIDGDGKLEFVATTRKKRIPAGANFYDLLSPDLVWLKPVDALKGEWAQHIIGTGNGDWPHSTAIAPLLPGGKLALITGYHNGSEGKSPELFEIPSNPAAGPWKQRTLANVPYGEEMVAADLDGDGDLDIAAGSCWLENKGDGTFVPHKLLDGYQVARVSVADMDGDGKPDIIVSEEQLSYKTHESFFARIAWIKNPGATAGEPEVHVIDRIRCPHSLSVVDIDGDGEVEIVAGEHDPFKPYRNRGNLYVYKKADPQGQAWYRYLLDDRFEHHDGARPIHLGGGRVGIVSHGWAESLYVHLWEPAER